MDENVLQTNETTYAINSIPRPPTLPNIGSGLGFTKMYIPDDTQLEAIAKWFWSPTFLESIIKLIGSPEECFYGLFVLPFHVPAQGSEVLKIGGVSSGISVNTTSANFFEVFCGSIDVKEKYENVLDYYPHTKISIYLPFIGEQELDVNEVMGHNISVAYRTSLIDGTFVCYVLIDNGVYCQFSGSCAMQIPTSMTNYDSLIRNGIQLLSQAYNGVKGGVAAAVSGGKVNTGAKIPSIADVATSYIDNKPSHIRTGNLSATSGWLGVMKPFLIITRDVDNTPADAPELVGLPMCEILALRFLKGKGYTLFEDVHLKDLDLTEPEIDELLRILTTEGAIF